MSRNTVSRVAAYTLALAFVCAATGASAKSSGGKPGPSEVKEALPPAPARGRAATFQEGQALAPMARATIFVRDIDTSLKLYRDILGLKPMFDNYWKGKGINDIQNTDNVELRAVVLMAGDSSVGNIGIYQLYNAKHRPPAPARNNDTRIGDVAVVFPTRDIWRLFNEIKSAGYVIISPPVTLIERPRMKQQPLEMMFRDPDGVLVNLVQAGVPE
jgi:catechol 2,3-dioxygenase-like lactoylglutathione lyase family enzyme